MLTPSSSKDKNTLNSPSQTAKIKKLDLFKNKIKEEIKKKNHYKSHLKPDSIKEYNKLSLELKDFSLDVVLFLLIDDMEVQTIKERLTKLKNDTKGIHSLKLNKKSIVYFSEENIKMFQKRVERYIKYGNMQCQVAYSKIEDSGDLLFHNVENAIYYIYHYFTKALDLQKKDGKKEVGKNIDNSCQDSSIDSTNEITLLKEQVNQLNKENTQLRNNQNNTKQQLDKDKINDLLKSKSELEHKIAQLQEQLNTSIVRITDMKNAILRVQEENVQLKKEVRENEAVLSEKDKKIEHLAKENILNNLSDKKSQPSKEAEEVKRLKSENNELQTKLQEFESKNKELEIEIQENKVQELEELKSTTNDLNAMLKKFEGIRAQLCEEIEELKQKLDNTQQNLTKKTNELEGTKAQFAKLQQDLDMKTSEVIELKGRTNSAKQHLDTEIKESINIKAQLEKLQRELTKKTEELENVSKKLDDANQKISQLEHERDDAQQQLKVLQNGNKELEGKNKEASTVNTQGIKGKVNYTSASFILFGACAVGASLTIPYLAACITLAIAASTFLVAGFCYSYKVNTALSDVEIDQQNKQLLESSI